MAYVRNLQITKAWQYGERGADKRIHYAIVRADGRTRHLHEDPGSALYVILWEALDAIGYFERPPAEGPVRVDVQN